MDKKINKRSLHFWMEMIVAVVTVLASVCYVVGAAVFGYYDDLNVFILSIAAVAALAAALKAVLAEKQGDKTLFALIGLAITAFLVAALMMIAEARVYSIAVLLFSELERDNVEGYNALYSSLASMVLYFVAVICNIVGSFCQARPMVKK